jgi:transcriptional regulator with XRE-family HTH domain
MSDAKREAQALERFAANIENLRRSRGLSLDALAERSELGREELARILSGETEANAGTIYLLAGALGADPGDLLSGIAWVPPADGGSGYVIDDPKGR